VTIDRAALLASLTTPPYEEIGRSVLGRPILARRFAGDRPCVLLKGAIHGDEPLGASLLVRLAAEIVDAHAWILPVANPDGYLVDRKHNERGVDLNRNFPSANWSAEHKPGYFPGDAAASEPETQALIALIDRIRPAAIVSIHSPFRTVNYDGPARELAERMAARNGYGASADIGYPTPGSFGSCYGIDRAVPVITLEIPRITVEEAWIQNRDALLEALKPL
jgi:protein MpaA